MQIIHSAHDRKPISEPAQTHLSTAAGWQHCTTHTYLHIRWYEDHTYHLFHLVLTAAPHLHLHFRDEEEIGGGRQNRATIVVHRVECLFVFRFMMTLAKTDENPARKSQPQRFVNQAQSYLKHQEEIGSWS